MQRFRKAFEGKEDKLVKEIDVESGLWTELQARKVLTERQIRNCKSCVCHLLLISVQNSNVIHCES